MGLHSIDKIIIYKNYMLSLVHASGFATDVHRYCRFSQLPGEYGLPRLPARNAIRVKRAAILPLFHFSPVFTDLRDQLNNITFTELVE